MAFTGRREIGPWVAVYVIGAVLGRNLCHHAGWPWWIGFTLVPALLVLGGLLLEALFRRRRRSRKKEDGPGSPPRPR
jgi:membrane protein implicated in regulation of membrane protease activity